MTRTDIINNLIEKKGYRNYLEIGVQRGVNFRAVNCANKTGVDPDTASKATLHITSDEFFRTNKKKFDIIFIDGLHHALQVYKDVNNALLCLADGGTIVCHDMNPPNFEAQEVPRIQNYWNGDCWMAWVWLRATRADLEMVVLDTDCGCGVIRKGKQSLLIIDKSVTFENLTPEWLNLQPAGYLSTLLQPIRV